MHFARTATAGNGEGYGVLMKRYKVSLHGPGEFVYNVIGDDDEDAIAIAIKAHEQGVKPEYSNLLRVDDADSEHTE